ncbi:Hypothetical protein NTJ_09067 [Nesidiocoris tenuis]|uniref:Uncharacterized protein n=1 Tax=Nesidiocoris tenuis TaxID=355587 RepID=A0ABN7AW82_9HEMI|nr:Hypothetical protein NTJ_09067 [Nesidiocoris tenuis]
MAFMQLGAGLHCLQCTRLLVAPPHPLPTSAAQENNSRLLWPAVCQWVESRPPPAIPGPARIHQERIRIEAGAKIPSDKIFENG